MTPSVQRCVHSSSQKKNNDTADYIQGFEQETALLAAFAIL